jgi:hypothetical protein
MWEWKDLHGRNFSDNNGNWSFTGAYTSAVTATATNNEWVTGEFAVPKFIQTYTYQNPTCVKIMVNNRNTIYFRNKNIIGLEITTPPTDTIYNQLDLFNLGPGIYQFVVEQTTIVYKSYTIVLSNSTPVINDQFPNIVNPSCGQQNGSISKFIIQGHTINYFGTMKS